MKNTFDWTRFLKLIKYDFNNMLNRALAFVLLPSALIAMVWLFTIIIGAPVVVSGPRVFIIMIGYYCALVMSTSFAYGVVNLPERGIPFAMLPASKCEKFWSMMLYTLVIIPVLSVAIVLVVDTLLYIMPFGPFKQSIFSSFDLNIFSFEQDGVLTSFLLMEALFISSLCNNHAQFFFTNTIFKKHKIILTLLALYVIGIALSAVILPILSALSVDNDNWLLKWYMNLLTNSPDTAANVILISGIVLNSALAILFYAWSWFRIKKARY